MSSVTFVGAVLLDRLWLSKAIRLSRRSMRIFDQ